MNPIALYVADGSAFFGGMLLVSLALGIHLVLEVPKPAVRTLLWCLFVIGLFIAILSATPIPLWLYAIWAGGSLVTLVLTRFKDLSPPVQKVRLGGIVCVIVLSLGLIAGESRYRTAPRMKILPGQSVYVIGDSLSAGTGKGESTWPAILAERLNHPVVNLAKAGVRADDGMRQATLIESARPLVIVEIGGNDLLGGGRSRDFADALDRLLAHLRQKEVPVLMFELPLMPFKNAFGKAQRELAEEYGVSLIPKKYLADIFRLKNGTIDGLHFSQAGHQALAESVAALFDVRTRVTSNPERGANDRARLEGGYRGD